MTEAEWMATAADWSSNAISAFAVYLTVTFAYLTSAFIAGRRLTNIQAAIGSTLYVFGASCTLFACLNGIMHYGFALSHYSSSVPSYFYRNPEFWIRYVAPLLFGGILVSLFFMWNVRNGKAHDA